MWYCGINIVNPSAHTAVTAMHSKATKNTPDNPPASSRANPGTMTPPASDGSSLDPVQLDQLEHAFRHWAEDSPRRDVRLSRRRILLIFLLIRYTGAKLNEILALDPFTGIQGQTICIRPLEVAPEECARKITIAESLADEIRETLNDPDFRSSLTSLFAIDPAFVRRKFYERAASCGFDKRLGGPEMIRRARALELMYNNMPLPAVQKLLGHSTPNLTAAHLSYPEEELQRITRFFMERESTRKTSARNTFFGKISTIRRGDIQAQVTLVTPGGYEITTLITNESLERLQLQTGRLVTAEVKAPWVILQSGTSAANTSADNRFQGEVIRINKGKVSAEYVVRIADGTELCAMMSIPASTTLQLQTGDPAWVVFNCFAVILHD